MALKFSAHYGLAPEDILHVTQEPIDLLLGVDAATLLLDKVKHLNGKIVKSPDWAPHIFLYGGDASDKFSLVGRLNISYPVETAREANFNAQGVFYLTEDKYNACKDILLSHLYTHHVGPTNSNVNYTDPPARVLKQTKCEPTPDADIFTVDDLVRISDEGSVPVSYTHLRAHET